MGSYATPVLTPGMYAQIHAKVSEAILGRSSDWPQGTHENSAPPSAGQVDQLAKEIAAEFTSQWQKLKNPRLQLRTLLWNLRDVQNPDFVRMVACRDIAPQQLPCISSEDMASAAKQSQRAVLRERHLQESTLHRSLSGMVDQRALQAYKALVSRR